MTPLAVTQGDPATVALFVAIALLLLVYFAWQLFRPRKATPDPNFVPLKLSEPAKKRLDDLRELTGARSNADVIRMSLQVYEFLIEERTNGAKFLVQSGDEEPEPITLIDLTAVDE